jgi:hypothetical protein
MNISVRQHIFANVPKEQSPRRRRGFQTLYHSAGLTPDEVLLLEERAQYFYEDSAPVKYQFHALPDGQAVVTQTVAVPEPDEYGRKGRYLAHSLILSAEAFRQMAFCPMPLLVARHFVADMAAAVAAGDRARGELPPKTVTVPDIDTWSAQTIEWARRWPTAELEPLARLGWRAAALRAQRQAVELAGDTVAMLQALSVCFLLCPPTKRPALTFDTYAYRCDWGRDWPFWAWGGLRDTPAETLYRVDGAARRVHGRLPDQDDTPFERWIARQAIPDRLEHLSTYEDDALRLDALLSGSGDLSGVDPEFGRQFAQLNAAAVARRVLAHVPTELGPARRDLLQKKVHSQPWVYLAQLSGGFNAPGVAAELVAVELALLRAPMTDAERKALGELAATAASEELNNLILLRGKDRDAWRRSLARLPDGAYRRVVEAALSAGVAAVADAFIVEHLDTWCAIAARTIRPGELKTVLRAIDGQGREVNVDSLEQIWPALDAADRQQLVDWVRRYPGPAPGLRAALGAPEPPAQPEPSRLGRLLPRFGRKSGESKDQG